MLCSASKPLHACMHSFIHPSIPRKKKGLCAHPPTHPSISSIFSSSHLLIFPPFPKCSSTPNLYQPLEKVTSSNFYTLYTYTVTRFFFRQIRHTLFSYQHPFFLVSCCSSIDRFVVRDSATAGCPNIAQYRYVSQFLPLFMLCPFAPTCSVAVCSRSHMHICKSRGQRYTESQGPR